MNFCILIELSKKTISFLYNRSDGEGKFKPFVGNERVLPLAIYCLGNDIQIGQYAIDEALNQNPHAYVDVFKTVRTVGSYRYKSEEWPFDTLLLNAVQKYLAYFFDSVLIGVKGRLEKNISNMPLCFMFSPDIEENERLFVKDSFTRNGYGNVAIFDYDQKVIETSQFSTPYAACVTSDGLDLFISLFETKVPKFLSNNVMRNRGKDPRVEIAIERLWDSLGYENYYLSLEREKATLAQVAENFLSSGENEFQENVLFSDGHTRECFLSLSELNCMRFKDEGNIVADVSDMLSKMNISPSDTTILLKGKAANNNYFKSIFLGNFSSVTNVTGSIHSKVLIHLLKDIQKISYSFGSESSTVNSHKSSIETTANDDQLLSETSSTQKIVETENKGDSSKYKREVTRLTRSFKMRADYVVLLQEAEDLLNRMHADSVHDFDTKITEVADFAQSHISINGNPKKYLSEVRRLTRGYLHRTDFDNLLKDSKDLLERMHNDNVHDFDAKITEVVEFAQKNLKSVKSKSKTVTTGTSTTLSTRSDSKKSSISSSSKSSKNVTSSNESKYRRDVNILTRGYKMRSDKDKLRQDVESLLKRMHDDGVTSFDEKLNEVLSFLYSAGTNSGNDATPKRGSKGSKSKPSPALEALSPDVSNSTLATRTKKQKNTNISTDLSSAPKPMPSKKSVSKKTSSKSERKEVDKVPEITSSTDIKIAKNMAAKTTHSESSSSTPPPIADKKSQKYPTSPIASNRKKIEKNRRLAGKSLTINEMKFHVVSDGNVTVNVTKCMGDVTIPASIKVDASELYVTSLVKGGMFSNCSKITSIILPPTIVSIGEKALASSRIENIELPKILKSIGDKAFYGCDRLVSFNLPRSLKQCNPKAFENCDNIKNVRYDSQESFLNVLLSFKALSDITFTYGPPKDGFYSGTLKLLKKVTIHVPEIWAEEYMASKWRSRTKKIITYN